MGPEPGGGKPAEWPSDYDAGVCVNQNLVDVTLLSGLHTLTLWPIKGTLGEGTHSLYGNEACCQLPPSMPLGLAVRLGESSPAWNKR